MNRELFFILVTAIVSLVSVSVLAQRPTGVIAGRVVTEDGQPIVNATVSLLGARPLRGGLGGRGAVNTDEDGNFQADGLDPMPYEIRVWAPGYVVAPNSKASDMIGELRQNYSYIGDSVMITMIKGGVITGKVINAAGEPVVGIGVRVIRIRDDSEQAVAGQRSFFPGSNRTDDRGVYRIYGLAPGSYLVSTAGNNRGYYGSPFDGKIDIYHPSSTRDTASEVVVRAGEEALGIDISYRSERGFSISGKITYPPANRSQSREMGVTVRKAATGTLVDSIFIPQFADQGGYAIYGLPNGEYELVAFREDRTGENSFASLPKRATINGRDAGGIDLALAPTASIAGAIAIEKNQAESGKCESKRSYNLDEIAIRVKRDEPDEKIDFPLSIYGGRRPVGAPNEQGSFTIRSLRPGRYRIEPQLPDENWYVKTMTMTTNDVGRHGVTLKSGEQASGLAVVIANGAAGLKGRIVAGEGLKLPWRLRVHLIPAEIEAKDDLLRFAEARAESDGSFNFTNLAPGKYLLIARPLPETEATDASARPVAWDNIERAKLRKEAEAAKVMVELKACRRIGDYVLRFAK